MTHSEWNPTGLRYEHPDRTECVCPGRGPPPGPVVLTQLEGDIETNAVLTPYSELALRQAQKLLRLL